MTQYVAFIWDADDPLQQRTVALLRDHLASSAPGLQEKYSADGLRVLCEPQSGAATRVTHLSSGKGVIIGSLFNRVDDSAYPSKLNDTLNHSASTRVINTRGRELIESFWGSYVAIVQESQSMWILRSPAGSLRCLYATLNGVRIFFSRMTYFASCGLFRFDISMKYVVSFLLISTERFRGTGIEQVHQLLPGECIEISRSGKETVHEYWNPLDVARVRKITDVAHATAAVESTTAACVHAWAAEYNNILLHLSGGVDSSALLDFLNSAPAHPEVHCVNLYSARADSDEREYARLVAKRLGYDLIEIARDPSTVTIEDSLKLPLTEKPDIYLAKIGEMAAQRQIVDSLGPSAIFTGNYGDNLFYNYDFQLPAADYIHDFGFGADLWNVLTNAARLGKLTLWEVLCEGLTKGARQYRWDATSQLLQMSATLNKQAIQELLKDTPSMHPWFDRNRYVPPGKQRQIHSILDPRACGVSIPFGGSTELPMITPFLSQPLIELCLQIPTYVLTRNGWDREIERRAFSAHLPAAVARRRTKGGHADYSEEVKRRNRAFIRDLLLNGRLVGSGLLIRSKLERALAGLSSDLSEGATRMSNLVNIELWMHLWANHKTEVAKISLDKQLATA